MHDFAHIRFQAQVAQGLLTREQAEERLLRKSVANIESSTTPASLSSTPLGEPQIPGFRMNVSEMPAPQLSGIYGQLMRAVEEGENNLNAPASTGGMQRRALRARLDGQKQLLINIQDLISLKRNGHALFLT